MKGPFNLDCFVSDAIRTIYGGIDILRMPGCPVCGASLPM